MTQPERRALTEVTQQQHGDSNGVQERGSKTALPDKDSTNVTLDLIGKKEWLTNQKLDLEAALATVVMVPSSNDVEKLDEMIASLQSDLLELSADHSNKEGKLQSAQCGSLLKEMLQEGDGLFSEKEKHEMTDMCHKQSELTTQILKELKEAEEMQKELDKTKRRCLEMKKSNRGLMLQLQEKQNSKEKEQTKGGHSEEIQRKKEALEEVATQISLLSGVFQGLIVGSGINWAEDPALADTVIELGQPIDD